MNPLEWRVTAGLSLIYALRMLGMFMILPVFALYASGLPGGVTALQIGLAVGIYGLTQALLQIPFGIASDRIGRKPVIIGGMLLFAAGSLLTGFSESIEWIIAGRALQGSGAVASAVSALLADSTREVVRTRAMALLGIGIGMSFSLAMVLGPVLSGLIGVDGIFLLTGVLALATLPMIAFAIPRPPQASQVLSGRFGSVLADPELRRLDAGIFLLHAALTAVFIAVPFVLVDTLGLAVAQHWRVYLPVMLIAGALVFPLLRWSERRGLTRQIFVAAIAALALALGTVAAAPGTPLLLLSALLLFFVAFNFLEGYLPSQVSRLAPSARKGAALGVYSTSQFLGSFSGALLGGWALGAGGVSATFAVGAMLPLLWLGFAYRQRPVPAVRAE